MKDMPNSNLSISFIKTEEYKSSPYNGCSVNAHDVLIYTLHLPDYFDLTKDLIRFLNLEERNRSERFFKEKDRNRFVICRSILKIVLAAHSNLDVSTINIDYDFNKKPYLASHPELQFNISHSENLAVIAISQNKVGIDIEYRNKDFEFNNLLADIFNTNEILDIQNAANKEYAFYSLWTRKEAFVKALGKGIDDDFKNIPCLNGDHSIDSALLKTAEKWEVYGFDLTEHYLGAIAFESSPTISKNLVWHTIPNTVNDLLEMVK
jgi:4'-phosphopantetheinyl transferase